MTVPTRAFNFVAGTTIASGEVDSEFDQLYDALSGTVDTTEINIKFSSATIPPLTVNQANSAGPILSAQISGNDAFVVTKDSTPKWLLNNLSEFVMPVGVLDANITSVSDAGTVETDLYNRTILGNTLFADGDYLHVIANGVLSNVPTGKVLRVYFDVTKIFDSSDYIADLDTTYWTLNIYIVRTASNTCYAITQLSTNDPSIQQTLTKRTGVTATLSANRTFRITGQANTSPAVTKDIVIVEKAGRR